MTRGRMPSIKDLLKGGAGGFASESAGKFASSSCGRERTDAEDITRATVASSHPLCGMADTIASIAEGIACQGAKQEQQAADRARANGANEEQATLEGLMKSPFVEPGAKAGIAARIEQLKANDASKTQ